METLSPLSICVNALAQKLRAESRIGPAPTGPLTDVESSQLLACIDSYRRGEADCADAIYVIEALGLWRGVPSSHPKYPLTFDQAAAILLGCTPGRIGQLRRKAEVNTNLTRYNCIHPTTQKIKPVNEAQARLLSVVRPDLQGPIVAEIVKNHGKVTAKLIKREVDKRRPRLQRQTVPPAMMATAVRVALAEAPQFDERAKWARELAQWVEDKIYSEFGVGRDLPDSLPGDLRTIADTIDQAKPREATPDGTDWTSARSRRSAGLRYIG